MIARPDQNDFGHNSHFRTLVPRNVEDSSEVQRKVEVFLIREQSVMFSGDQDFVILGKQSPRLVGEPDWLQKLHITKRHQSNINNRRNTTANVPSFANKPRFDIPERVRIVTVFDSEGMFDLISSRSVVRGRMQSRSDRYVMSCGCVHVQHIQFTFNLQGNYISISSCFEGRSEKKLQL